MPEEIEIPKVPIRGWLILIGINLWGSVIGALLGLIGSIFFHVRFGYPVWIEYLLVICEGAFNIAALVFFLKREKVFIKWFNLSQILSIVHYFVYLVDGTDLYNNILGIIIDFLLILYILRSKRVKNTFVR